MQVTPSKIYLLYLINKANANTIQIGTILELEAKKTNMIYPKVYHKMLIKKTSKSSKMAKVLKL